MMGGIRVDGVPYRWMGPVNTVWNATAMNQVSVTVAATQTQYTFSVPDLPAVVLVVTFSTPAVPSDLSLLSLPITFISMNVVNSDSVPHHIELYLDHTGELFTAS